MQGGESPASPFLRQPDNLFRCAKPLLGKEGSHRRYRIEPLMYTLPMTWSFRMLAGSMALIWVLVPQLACFMPDPAATPAEMECCQKMKSDCSGMNMSHECCRTPD